MYYNEIPREVKWLIKKRTVKSSLLTWMFDLLNNKQEYKY